MRQKSLSGLIGGLGILGIILNFALWGGLIYFVFWCLKHFGIIG